MIELAKLNFCSACGSTLDYTNNRWTCIKCGEVYYKNPIVGVAGVYIKDKKVLLGKRKGSYQDKWCIPCGYVDYHESIESALDREFYEETNLMIGNISFYHVGSNFHNPRQHTVGVYYRIDNVYGKLKAKDDLKEVQFFDYDSIHDLAFPMDQFVLKKLKDEGLL